MYAVLRSWVWLVTLLLLQNAVIEGQDTPLRLSFAKDKPTERPPSTSTIASDALQVSEASILKPCHFHVHSCAKLM